MSLNKVMLIGNVGTDPEVRYLDGNGAAQNGSSKVATFRLATTERYRDRSGENRENTEWHSIVCWRNSADIVEKYVKKGSQIYVEGRLRTREWTDAQGVKKFRTEVNVDSLQLLGRRPDGEGSPYQAAAPGAQPQSQPTYAQTVPVQAPEAPAAPVADPSDNTDDLPF
ncbi:MAG: single-stranded DNA-binding protein [Bacteroidales bacterium]|nr:single-stranded DNA-binding protein [Bacteroidales bacterium]